MYCYFVRWGRSSRCEEGEVNRMILREWKAGCCQRTAWNPKTMWKNVYK